MITIRQARDSDVERVRAVARAAGERFREVPDPRIARCADDPPPTAAELRDLAGAGRLLIVEVNGRPEGYAALSEVDGHAHVEEVSVDPEVQGRGLGSALLVAAMEWAGRHDLDGLTLTTFRDVSWNRPYYERRGFSVMEADEIGPDLAAVMAHEADLGLEPDLRVAMRRTRTRMRLPDPES